MSVENLMLEMSGEWTHREIVLANCIDRLRKRVDILESLVIKKEAKKRGRPRKNPIIISK